MITASDAPSTIEADKYFVIVPNSLSGDQKLIMERYLSHYTAKPVKPGFRYSSGENSKWLSAKELRELIHAHVDPTFAIGET